MLTNITIKYITINIVRIYEILFDVGSETLEAASINLVSNKIVADERKLILTILKIEF